MEFVGDSGNSPFHMAYILSLDYIILYCHSACLCTRIGLVRVT